LKIEVNTESDQKELTFIKGVAMEKTVKREKQDNATRMKKPYLAPFLVCYGTLKELTRGGSGTYMEGSAMILKMLYP